jgi:hypothetical protein
MSIDLVGSVVGKPVDPETVIETTEKDDVVLERNIRPASAAPAAEESPSRTSAARSGRIPGSHRSGGAYGRRRQASPRVTVSGVGSAL